MEHVYHQNYIVRHIIKFIYIFKQINAHGPHSSFGSAFDLQLRGPGSIPRQGKVLTKKSDITWISVYANIVV